MLKTIVFVFMLALMAACDSETNTQAIIQNIDSNSAQSLALDKQSVVILDVRTPEEYALSHIEGAVNIDISNDKFKDNAALFDRDKTYIVHCAANVPNGRTAKSLIIMDELGFNNLLNLEGGIVAWEQAGQAVVKDKN